MKFILLTFVRSEEDDSLGLVPLNISLFVHLLWGFPKRSLFFGRTLVSKRGFKPNTEAQVLASHRLYGAKWSFEQRELLCIGEDNETYK